MKTFLATSALALSLVLAPAASRAEPKMVQPGQAYAQNQEMCKYGCLADSRAVGTAPVGDGEQMPGTARLAAVA